MSTCPHTCLQPNFGSLFKIVDGCHFGQPHHKIGKKKTEKPLVFGARRCQRFLTSKMSPVEKTACNLHKRMDFLGKNTPKFATFQGRKTGFKSPFLDYRFLQLARFGEVLLLLKDSKSTCVMKLTKKKRKPQLVQCLERAKNSSKNLVRRAQRTLCKFGDQSGEKKESGHSYTYINKDGNPFTKSIRHVKANVNTQNRRSSKQVIIKWKAQC